MEKIKIDEEDILAGINWGVIEEKGWFGAKGYAGVDLDLNILIIDQTGKRISEHNWKKRLTDIIKISKDDNIGDILENDKKDNEYALISLSKIQTYHRAVIFVNNYTEQELGKLSHFDYRIYAGNLNEPKKVFHYYDLQQLGDFENSYGIFLGILEHDEENWYYSPYEKCLHEKGIKDRLNQIMPYISLW